MWRFTIALLVAVVASGTAEGADRALARHMHRAAVNLPAGLPRSHYHFRTTISYGAPYPYRRSGPRLSVYETPELLYAPDYADVPYIRPWIGTPLFPGSSTLPSFMDRPIPTITRAPITAARMSLLVSPALRLRRLRLLLEISSNGAYGFAVRIAALSSRVSRLSCWTIVQFSR